MRNFTIGLLLGVLIATGAGVWANSESVLGGSVLGGQADSSGGLNGMLLTPQGDGGVSIYRDSSGRNGTIIQTPGGATFFNINPGPGTKSPC